MESNVSERKPPQDMKNKSGCLPENLTNQICKVSSLTIELKKQLDSMLQEAYRDQEDKTQVFKIELYICSDDVDAALALKPLYMKTSESPYIFDFDYDSNKISIFYIPAMKIIYNIRKTLESQPENDIPI